MKKFDEFISKLLDNSSQDTMISIEGDKRRVKAMVRLTSKNLFPAEYIKILFNDHSFMLILLDEKEIYFADKLDRHIKEIPDHMIGEKRIFYKGKEYYLDNPDDYQFVLQLHVGTPFDIEGECRFWDYFPVDGTKEFLSLGWLASTGERADINPIFIDINKVRVCC